MIGRSLARAVVCALLTCTAARASAADDTRSAAALFKIGEAAYTERRFKEAAIAFEEAHRRAPRAATLYAAGVSWDEAGESGRSADALEQALAGVDLDAGSRADARARLLRLQAVSALVEIDGPPGALASVGHVAGVSVPARIHLPPGPHVVRRVDIDGATSTKIFARGGDAIRVTLPPPAPAAPSSSPLRTAGWVSIGASGVFSAGAIVLGLATLSARDRFADSGDTDARAHDRALTFRTMTNVAWAAAAVAGAGGITLLVLAPRGAPARVAVGAGELHCAVAF